MFIPIKIDLDDLVQEFGLDGSQIQILATELTNRITDKYVAAIKQKVNTTLKTTRGIYLKNLRVETIDDTTREIILSGWLPNAIESGVESFDMKPGFQNAKNVRVSIKGNWYTTIPFSWSKEGGETGAKVPNNLYGIVTKQKSPLRESQIPESQRLHQIKQLVNGGTYQHKNSIYAGIQKSSPEYGNGHVSFRRVGAVSDANAFWHPGLTKKEFFKSSLNEIQMEIPVISDKIIDEFLKSQGFN